MDVSIIKGDLFEQKVDAIVIPSQPSLALQGAVGGKAKEICGPLLAMELEQYKKIAISDCVIAHSHCDNFPYVILVANPRWQGGKYDEDFNLETSYQSCLEIARKFGLHRIAFPLLSAGAYGFSRAHALDIAQYAINHYTHIHPEIEALLVLNSAPAAAEAPNQQKKRGFYEWYDKGAAELSLNGVDGAKFVEKLEYYRIISDSKKIDCYMNVISKTMFDNYLNGKSIPKKYTAVALGLQMNLGVDEINDLLAPLNARLDEMNPADKIIINGIRDGGTVDSINEDLIANNYQPLKSQ